jgi:hypothetical protein
LGVDAVNVGAVLLLALHYSEAIGPVVVASHVVGEAPQL